jgi:hypothetical protein
MSWHRGSPVSEMPGPYGSHNRPCGGAIEVAIEVDVETTSVAASSAKNKLTEKWLTGTGVASAFSVNRHTNAQAETNAISLANLLFPFRHGVCYATHRECHKARLDPPPRFGGFTIDLWIPQFFFGNISTPAR